MRFQFFPARKLISWTSKMNFSHFFAVNTRKLNICAFLGFSNRKKDLLDILKWRFENFAKFFFALRHKVSIQCPSKKKNNSSENRFSSRSYCGQYKYAFDKSAKNVSQICLAVSAKKINSCAFLSFSTEKKDNLDT